MQTIGERLEEARKRRNVTVQDAARETKIREEYLTHLEKDSGAEIPLEPIYVRAFIRNYAKFLRMDPGKLLADFDASHTSESGVGLGVNAPKVQKELIGRLELGNDTPPTPTLGAKESPIETAETSPAQKKPDDGSKRFKVPAWAAPVAVGFVAVLLIAGVFVGVGNLAKNKTEAKAAKAAAVSELKLVALGDVTVIAKQVEGDVTLFAGTLKKGEEKTFNRQGSVRVQYSEGNLLEMVKDGKQYKMGAAGAGKRIVE